MTLTESSLSRKSALTVFLVSGAIISLQLCLIRILSVTRWYHFSFFVISTALLGFGVSGIVLLFAGRSMLRNYTGSCFWLCLLSSAPALLVLTVAQSLPLDSQYLLHSTDQLGLFVLINILTLLPFLFGAILIGLVLMNHREKAGSLYGFSMVGSAAGSLISVVSMYVLSEERLLLIPCSLAWIAALIWWDSKHVFRVAGVAVCFLGLAFFGFRPKPLVVEPYKTLSLMQRWTEQGDARCLLTQHSPRGRVDVYESHLLHYTLFAGLNARQAPPPELAILRDGNLAGTVFKIQAPDAAAIMDQTPSAVAYHLASAGNVLILGESGGANVWLARLAGARRITIVQPDPMILKVMKFDLANISGNVFEGKDISVVEGDPRIFLEQTRERFDTIHLASEEEMAAGTGGIGGLHEDFLLTAEGLRAAFRCLSPSGVLVITRGIQTPPRDSLKLLTTMLATLNAEHVDTPERHIVLTENYLADSILLFRKGVTADDFNNLKSLAEARALKIVWPPSGSTSGQNTTDDSQFPSMEESISAIFSSGRERFVHDWVFDIRPAEDARPFFRDFFRIRAMSWMQEVYQGQWFQRLELGFAILIAVFAISIVCGVLFILVPMIFWSRGRRSGEGWLKGTLGYFALIGFGFMAFEITLISRLTFYLGDPVYSATLGITVLLLGAGVGSLRSSKTDPRQALSRACIFIVAIGGLLLASTFAPVSWIASLSFGIRACLCSLLMLPLAYFMGFPFACGLHIMRARSEDAVPWAWSMNGFASVVAPPLFTAMAMSASFRWVIVAGIVSYALIQLCLKPPQD